MNGLSQFAGSIGPSALPIAAVCALFGTLMIARHVDSRGVFSFLLNYTLLLMGALVCNLLGSGLIESLRNRMLEPILLSVAGMTVSALILLSLAARHHHE